MGLESSQFGYSQTAPLPLLFLRPGIAVFEPASLNHVLAYDISCVVRWYPSFEELVNKNRFWAACVELTRFEELKL
jgi:hypothetical protein